MKLTAFDLKSAGLYTTPEAPRKAPAITVGDSAFPSPKGKSTWGNVFSDKGCEVAAEKAVSQALTECPDTVGFGVTFEHLYEKLRDLRNAGFEFDMLPTVALAEAFRDIAIIKNSRKYLGISQHNLSSVLGLSDKYVWNMESGNRRVSDKTKSILRQLTGN